MVLSDNAAMLRYPTSPKGDGGLEVSPVPPCPRTRVTEALAASRKAPGEDDDVHKSGGSEEDDLSQH